MIYKLKFTPSALKEWKKLDSTINKQFKKKLEERLHIPRVESSRIIGFEDYYKIKLRTVGYRLAYKVDNKYHCIIVVKIGKRDKIYSDIDKLLRFYN